MNSINDDFNGIHSSGRPFSGGHPDGVWVISIIYSLVCLGLVFSSVMSIVQMYQGNIQFAAALVLGVFFLTLYLSCIVTMFRKSSSSIKISSILAGFSVLAFIVVALLKREVALLSSIPMILHVYIAYYVYGLKNDGLIG